MGVGLPNKKRHPVRQGKLAHWVSMFHNSEQFKGRFSLVEVMDLPSILMQGMAGSFVPIAVAHGEGRAEYKSAEQRQNAQSIMRIVDHNE